MKWFQIDPESKLSEPPIFKLVSMSFPLLSLILIFIIFINSDLKADFSYKGFNFALFTIFKVPLAVLATGVTILGFIAAIHRSSQTTLQIKKASEQNIFSNFYKHRQEYEDHFKNINDEFPEHIKSNITDKIIRGYYSSTFPENCPSRFVLKPRLSWLESFDEGLIEMSYILSKMHASDKGCHILLLYSEFLRQETSIRQGLFEINRPENAEVNLENSKTIIVKYWNGRSNRISIVENLMHASYQRLKDYAEYISKLKYIVGEFEGTMIYGCNSYAGLSTLEYHNKFDDDEYATRLLYSGDSDEIEMSESEYEELKWLFKDIRDSYERKVSELDNIKENNIKNGIEPC